MCHSYLLDGWITKRHNFLLFMSWWIGWFSWSHLDLLVRPWSAVTVLGEPQLGNSALFSVLSHLLFSDKGGGTRGRAENARSFDALAQNWHLVPSTFYCPSRLKASPILQPCYVDDLNTNPNPDSTPFWASSFPLLAASCINLHCQNSNSDMAHALLLHHFPFLTPLTSPQTPAPSHTSPTCPGKRNRREDSSSRLEELQSHLTMGVDTGRN